MQKSVIFYYPHVLFDQKQFIFQQSLEVSDSSHGKTVVMTFKMSENATLLLLGACQTFRKRRKIGTRTERNKLQQGGRA